MQTAISNVVDFGAFRDQRRRQRDLATAPITAFPVAWVVVWFAPVLLVQPPAVLAGVS